MPFSNSHAFDAHFNKVLWQRTTIGKLHSPNSCEILNGNYCVHMVSNFKVWAEENATKYKGHNIFSTRRVAFISTFASLVH